MRPLRIFLGYDSREPLAYHVAAHSILRRASIPVAITPLVQPALRAAGLYWRARGPTESTEFSLTRFLVPLLCGYEGLAVFMDSDVLVRADVADLLAALDPTHAVSLVQHDYVPAATQKMGGLVQTAYPRKNWSSLIVFNNARCAGLTPAYVNTASGLELHRFAWLADDAIGRLPLAWNYLVGEGGQTTEPPKLVHFTTGGPWFSGYETVEYADLWRAEYAHLRGDA